MRMFSSLSSQQPTKYALAYFRLLMLGGRRVIFCAVFFGAGCTDLVHSTATAVATSADKLSAKKWCRQSGTENDALRHNFFDCV